MPSIFPNFEVLTVEYLFDFKRTYTIFEIIHSIQRCRIGHCCASPKGQCCVWGANCGWIGPGWVALFQQWFWPCRRICAQSPAEQRSNKCRRIDGPFGMVNLLFWVVSIIELKWSIAFDGHRQLHIHLPTKENGFGWFHKNSEWIEWSGGSNVPHLGEGGLHWEIGPNEICGSHKVHIRRYFSVICT